MKRFLGLLTLSFILTAPALFAQATRTWVSGVGDDANPCSRTAPGKTFAGAISKTATDGEISVLDPGGFGAVTITKSITINGDGTLASVLAAASNGIVINATDTSVVTLRSLSFEGVGGINGGLVAIKILKAAAVHIENCTIDSFRTGISFESSTPGAQLFVNGCRIHKCSGTSVSLNPANADADARIGKTEIDGNGAGIVLGKGIATVTDCSVSGNATVGFEIGAGTQMSLISSVSSGNATGVSSAGILAMSDSTITNNAGAGLQQTGVGTILSYKDNRIMGNNPNGSATKFKARR